MRDVSEDLRRPGRVYLPQIWMEQWSLTSTDLEDAIPDAYPKAPERTVPAVEKQYEGSRPGSEAIPLRARLVIRSAAHMCREIMNKARTFDRDNLHHQAYVPLSCKPCLIVQYDYAHRKEGLWAQHRTPFLWLPSTSASSIT